MPKDNYSSMNPKKRKAWEKILKSSSYMAEVAKKNDWELLQKLIEERKSLLSNFFDDSVANDRKHDLDMIKRDIKLILEQDEETRLLSASNREIVLNKLSDLKTGRDAVKLYR